MKVSNFKLHHVLLKHQIELEESNLKYAVELKKDYDLLYRMRENIRILKEELRELESTRPNRKDNPA